MRLSFFWSILTLLFLLGIEIFLGYLFSLLLRALEKYLGEGRREERTVRVSLSQRLKQLRMEKAYTQEYVAEMLGVSRQAVSKWENGTAEPSTSKLFAIAKLYGIEVSQLLDGIEE